MIFIAHRGRTTPSDPENDIFHINECLKKYLWMHSEIDIWYFKRNGFFIGHDLQNAVPIKFDWLNWYSNRLLIHAKNLEAYEIFSKGRCFNVFMHDTDPIGISTDGWVIANYDLQPEIKNVILHPRSGDVNMEWITHPDLLGVMTDDPIKYRNLALEQQRV
jgi:hypothetical protein